MKRSVLYPSISLAAFVVAWALFHDRLGRGEASVNVAPSDAPLPLVTAAPTASASVSAQPSARVAPPPAPAYVHENPDSARACGAGMILVDGVHCPFVGHRCLEFVDEDKDVCARYDAKPRCEGRLEKKRYCIDEYEYPDIEGVVPAVMVDFDEAEGACASEGKRLCTAAEWEFACEGPQMWPYPYGLERDADACNIDKSYREPELAAFSNPWKTSAEVERLDQRVPSGSMPKCVSPFGVRDMTGNVDEWVVNENGKRDEKPYRSGLKGGYWGPIRARCRPMTTTHNEWFSFYQVGFRCCRDAR